MQKTTIIALLFLLGISLSLAQQERVYQKQEIQEESFFSILVSNLGFGSKIRGAANPGCEPSPAYTQQCEDNGGSVCGETLIGRDVCCQTSQDCLFLSKSIWGYTKEWSTCQHGTQIQIGDCPE